MKSGCSWESAAFSPWAECGSLCLTTAGSHAHLYMPHLPTHPLHFQGSFWHLCRGLGPKQATVSRKGVSGWVEKLGGKFWLSRNFSRENYLRPGSWGFYLMLWRFNRDQKEHLFSKRPLWPADSFWLRLAVSWTLGRSSTVGEVLAMHMADPGLIHVHSTYMVPSPRPTRCIPWA